MTIQGREVLIYTWANNKHKGPHYLGMPCDIDSKKLKLSLLTERRKALHKTPPPQEVFVKAQKEGRQRNEQTNKQKSTCMCKPFNNLHNYCVPPHPPPTPLQQVLPQKLELSMGISFFFHNLPISPFTQRTRVLHINHGKAPSM